MGITIFRFFFSPGRTHSCHEAAIIYIDENKQNQIIPAMEPKDRTVLHHHGRDTSSVGSRMKLYGENRTACVVKG